MGNVIILVFLASIISFYVWFKKKAKAKAEAYEKEREAEISRWSGILRDVILWKQDIPIVEKDGLRIDKIDFYYHNSDGPDGSSISKRIYGENGEFFYDFRGHDFSLFEIAEFMRNNGITHNELFHKEMCGKADRFEASGYTYYRLNGKCYMLAHGMLDTGYDAIDCFTLYEISEDEYQSEKNSFETANGNVG